jgi:nitrile hydratase
MNKNPIDNKLGRRKFLSGAAKTAAIGAAAITGKEPMTNAQHNDSDEHEHDHQDIPSDIALRVKALETVLVEKQMIDPADIDEIVDNYENRVGPQNGAQVVAKAWTDPEFKARLLADGTAAIGEMNFLGAQGEHMVVVENTPQIHNLVVCTLCSCYPWPTLGLPPTWYKSNAYRSRAVIDPRGVLAEFDLAIDESVEVRVWDSTAEMRYLVLPQRPAGTDSMSEEELAEIVTRDSMIGVAKVNQPQASQ